MKANIEYVEQKFKDYNDQMFGGRLPMIPVRLSDVKSYLGKCKYSVRVLKDGRRECYNFEMLINTRIDLPENVVEDVIIHEMIHYYILSNQLQDTSAHGKLFRKLMNDINTRFGRNVTISHKSTEEEKEQDCEIRSHLICVSRLVDGRVGITIAARTRVFMLWDEIARFDGVAECKWYYSNNPYFNRFRRSLKVKIYIVDNDELERQLADAVSLVRNGNKLHISSLK